MWHVSDWIKSGNTIDDEKKKSLYTRLKNWVREQHQIWLRKHIIKKIAKLTPIGPEISLEKFLGKEEPYTSPRGGAPCSGFEYEILEEGKMGVEECQHGFIDGARNCFRSGHYPKKLKFSDGDIMEVQVRTNEECQKAFRELVHKQLFPEHFNYVCPHCKKAEEL
jgi:hypothetical protein